MAATEKHCSRCCQTKPAGDFGIHLRAKDGLQYWCRQCKREHYVENRTAVLAQQHGYRLENRERVREGKRRHYHAFAERHRERSRQYRAENGPALKEKAHRRYADGGRPEGKPWPNGAVSYSTAHSRVKATYGSASNYSCCHCGKRAYAWSYDHSDPNPLMHQGVGLWADKPPVPYSPDPSRYDPMCRSCHVKRDRYGLE